MASSQVEVVASSPFGCVLRDHRNRRSDRAAAHATFEKNLKDLVRDHIKTCISIQDTSSNSHIDSWVADPGSTSTSSNNNNVNHVASPSASPTKQSPHSRIIDKLAAKQARQIASAVEKQAQDAAEIITPAAASTLSPKSNESSPSEKNARASSLVQIWEARLNRVDSFVSSTGTGPATGSQDNSPTAAATTTAASIDNSTQQQDSIIEEDRLDGESSQEQTRMPSESTSASASASAPAAAVANQCLLKKEKERVRVVDIIKRLYNDNDQHLDHQNNNNNNNNNSNGNNLTDQSPTRNQAASAGISLIVHSPKLRGRQAFQDLLMQMERDRHKELDSLLERHVVSKFPQRGRIQSVLRLRCLQRGLIISNSSRPLLNKIRTSKSSAETQESNIMQLREKFSSSKNWVMSAQSNHIASARTRRREMAKANQQHSVPVPPPSTEQVPKKPPAVPLPENNSNPPTTKTKCPVTPSTDQQVKPQETTTTCSTSDQSTLPKKPAVESLKTNDECPTNNNKPQLDHVECQTNKTPSDSQKTKREVESTHVSTKEEDNQIAKEKNALNLQQQQQQQQRLDLASSVDQPKCSITSSGDVPVEKNAMVEEGVETRTFYNDWDENEMIEEEEEEEDYQQYFEESNYDWFSDISRPRSYWESLRQAWYEEVLSSTKEDKGIRQLLERRSVSTILASDFRDKMDRLVMSRVEMQVEQGEINEDELCEEEREQQVLSYLKNHLDETTTTNQETQHQQMIEEEDDEDEGGSTSSHQCQQETTSGYYSQSSPASLHMPSPSLMISWSYQDDAETSDHDSHRQIPPYRSSPSPAPPQSFPTSQQSSSTRPSLEMELICELRGQMEQLYREMGELRKSIVSCMDMQMKVHQSGGGQGKNQADTDSERVSLKRTCCICYEMQVDSIMYRCGHMCTCLKCAHALQWSNGKCPTCRAPIVDVVQAIVGS